MSKVIFLIVLAISCDFSAGLGGLGLVTPVTQSVPPALLGNGLTDLPSFMPKCSLTDPKVLQCLMDTANQMIPIIAKGDVRYGIPSLSPIKYREAPFYGNNLTIVLEEACTDDWKKMKMIDCTLDLQNLKAGFVGYIDRVLVTAENYTITEGKILDISAYGHGKFNMTCLGMKMNFYGGLRFYNKGLNQYLEYTDSKGDMSVDRCYFHFENLQSAENGDVNAYIEANWERFFKQIKPALDLYIDSFVDMHVNAIISPVPFSNLFLP